MIIHHGLLKLFKNIYIIFNKNLSYFIAQILCSAFAISGIFVIDEKKIFINIPFLWIAIATSMSI